MSSKRLTNQIFQGAILALIPAIGYALALCFEIGFGRRYGIPTWLIRVDTAQIVYATAVVFGAILTLANILGVLPNRPWGILIALVVVPSIFIGVAYLIFRYTVAEWSVKCALLLTLGIAAALAGANSFYWNIWSPVRRREEHDTWWIAWEKRFASHFRRLKPSAVEALNIQLTEMGLPNPLLMLTACALAAELVAGLGEREADSQRIFLLRSADPQCIAIRRYGEQQMCVEIDTAKRQILRRFKMLSLSDTSTFELVNLGTLNVEPVKKTCGSNAAACVRIQPSTRHSAVVDSGRSSPRTK